MLASPLAPKQDCGEPEGRSALDPRSAAKDKVKGVDLSIVRQPSGGYHSLSTVEKARRPFVSILALMLFGSHGVPTDVRGSKCVRKAKSAPMYPRWLQRVEIKSCVGRLYPSPKAIVRPGRLAA